jgi:hypothetical protein
VLRRRRTDPLARNTLLAIAAGRVAIGVGALFATRPALSALGFRDADASARVLGKIVGERDIALGLLAIVARDEPAALRATATAGVAVDAADAIALGAAARNDGLGAAGFIGALSGGAAAIAGVWAVRRLR